MTPRIAWIGLGLIGLPMAARLAAAGHRVLGFDIDGARMALAAGVPLPIARHMQAVYRGVLDSDLAAEDFLSIVKLAERNAGLGEP